MSCWVYVRARAVVDVPFAIWTRTLDFGTTVDDVDELLLVVELARVVEVVDGLEEWVDFSIKNVAATNSTSITSTTANEGW
jgi:hypothetical protein